MPRWLLLIVALLCAPLAQAQEPRLTVPGQMLVETSTPKAGGSVTVALLFTPEPGWHGYWENPGDAGLGLQLEWSLPEGVTAGKPRFPVPKPLLIGGLMNHVYEAPHVALVDLQLPSGLKEGTALPISIAANWLACTDTICVPQQDRFETRLTIGSGAIEETQRKRFDGWRALTPVPLDREAHFAVAGKRYQIAIPYPASAPLDRPYFFALTQNRIRYAAPQLARRNGDWLVIESEAGTEPGPVEGLLRIGEGQGLWVRSVSGQIPGGGSTVTTLRPDGAPPNPATNDMLPFPWLLLAAIAGGLLLNLMPCVFPILGLKAFALAKAGGSESEARADALAYSAGVIFSCIALGGLMLLLRAGGEEIGWAFQLQEPAFVLFLLILMVVVTANLAGLFELRGFEVGSALTKRSGTMGSFWTGVLAALVATPCTGPFMAAALGAALLLPPLEALLLFGALGFGIALPFLLIAYVPRLRALLPKPGPWLNAFRKWMAVPMALTALALGWLLWRQAGEAGLWIGLAAVAASLLIIVTYRRMHLRMRNAGLLSIAMLVTLYTGVARWLPDDKASPASAAANSDEIVFSENRLADLRAKGTPVFLYFTADWCVTCKVNEAAAINRAETQALFKKRGIVVMVGDFTRHDPEIARFLSAHGRSGVPFYLYYPKSGKPRELPQLLTPAIIADSAQ